MPGTARLTTRRGLGKALAYLGAAGALAGAGAVTAATVTEAAEPAAAAHAPLYDAAATTHARHAAREVSAHTAYRIRRAAGRHHAAGRDHAAGHARRHVARVRHPVPARPYSIYDSTTPAAIPAHHAVATYATGSYAASPAAVAGRKSVLWIDTNGTDTRASALDVEPGDATPALAATWADHKLTAQPRTLARIYTMRSEWPAVQAAVAALPARIRAHVRWWIADPTGIPHMVPGAAATQWYWGPHYDISTASPRF